MTRIEPEIEQAYDVLVRAQIELKTTIVAPNVLVATDIARQELRSHGEMGDFTYEIQAACIEPAWLP